MARLRLKTHCNRLCCIGIPVCLALLLAACNDGSPGKTKKSRTINVEMGVVQLSPLTTTQVLVSRLQPEKKVRIFNQEEGRIVALPYREGHSVSTEQIIVRIDDTLLKKSLNKAEAQSRQARLDLQRLRALAKRKLASQDELARAETALIQARAEQELLETRLQHTAIRAPFTGVVTQRLVEEGDVAEKHSHLLTLMDVSRLRIEADISELLVSQINKGQQAEVRIDALGEKWFSGTVQRVFPSIDTSAQQGRIEIILDQVPQGALPGHLCRVRITSEISARLNIPSLALRHDSLGEFVYRINGDHTVSQVRVEAGIQAGSRLEILSGLNAAERVVTKGFSGLKDGVKITITPPPAVPGQAPVQSITTEVSPEPGK